MKLFFLSKEVEVIFSLRFDDAGIGLKERLPGSLINLLFKAKDNEFVIAASDKSTFIAKVDSITPATFSNSELASDNLTKQLRESFIGDSTNQFSDALRNRLGVKIDQAAIAAAF